MDQRFVYQRTEEINQEFGQVAYTNGQNEEIKVIIRMHKDRYYMMF